MHLFKKIIRGGLMLLGITIVQIVLGLVGWTVKWVKTVLVVLGVLCTGPAVIGLVAMLAVAGNAIFSWYFLGHWPTLYTLADFSHDNARWLPQMLVDTILNSSIVLDLFIVAFLLAFVAYLLAIAAVWLGRIGEALARGVSVVEADKQQIRPAKEETIEIMRNSVSSDIAPLGKVRMS